MPFSDKRSDIWNAVLPALREGGTTIEDICDETGHHRIAVIRVLRSMADYGWVGLPLTDDDDETIRPGDAATEYLRE